MYNRNIHVMLNAPRQNNFSSQRNMVFVVGTHIKGRVEEQQLHLQIVTNFRVVELYIHRKDVITFETSIVLFHVRDWNRGSGRPRKKLEGGHTV